MKYEVTVSERRIYHSKFLVDAASADDASEHYWENGENVMDALVEVVDADVTDVRAVEEEQGPDCWLDTWRAAWKANSLEAERNSSMDSAWSASRGELCDNRRGQLLRELANKLAAVTIEPADLFDRPDLALCVEAAKEVG